MINSYAKQVQKVEHLLQRFADLVKCSNLQARKDQTLRYDEAFIQYKERILAIKLRLQCNILILSDFVELGNGAASIQTKFEVDLSAHLSDSKYLIELAHKHVHPREEVKGHVFAAQLYGFSRSLISCAPLQPSINSTISREVGQFHLARSREILVKYSFTALLGA